MADLTVTAANVAAAAGAATGDGTAGEALTQGQTLYKHTDGKMYKALADTAAHAAAIGIALNAAASGQPVRYLKSGGLNPGATVTVGEIYVISGTAGGIAPEADLASEDFVTLIGVGTTATNIDVSFNASGVAVPT